MYYPTILLTAISALPLQITLINFNRLLFSAVAYKDYHFCCLKIFHFFQRHGRMINAVLVFNNKGEPRLTKFYTQIVCNELPVLYSWRFFFRFPRLTAPGRLGYTNTTEAHPADLPPRLSASAFCLQLPSPSAIALAGCETVSS